MFENYKEMTDAEKAHVKAIHKAVRKEVSSRAGGLAWAFIRGFAYRRVERTTLTQTMIDGTVIHHNPPSLLHVATILVEAMPELETMYLKSKYALADSCPLHAWYRDPSGAVPVPVRAPMQPFVRAEVA